MGDVNCNGLLQMVIDEVTASWACTGTRPGEFLLAAPVTYADGDRPEILVTVGEGHVATITDFGSTCARLTSNGLSVLARAPRIEIESTARAYGLLFTDEFELRREVGLQELGSALMDMASAMVRLDALTVLRSPSKEPPFSKSLTSLLVSEFDQVTPRYETTGRSGSTYRVDAAVQVDRRLTLVQSIPSRASTDPRPIDHTFRVWSDIQLPASERLSVLARPPSEYVEADIRLLESVSVVGTWVEQDLLLSYLRTRLRTSSGHLYTPSPTLLD